MNERADSQWWAVVSIVTCCIAAGALFASGCSGESTCQTNDECAQNQVCASSGGVLFEQKRCVPVGEADAAHVDASGDGNSMGCLSNTDCQAPHVDAVCTSTGTCRYIECAQGYVDTDGELSNGCECPSSDVREFWADCDGDEYPPPSDRAVKRDFCTQDGPPSETPSACPSSDGQWVRAEGMGRRDCDDRDPNIFPGFPGETSPRDEGWLCDGVDNDCDGETDEQCCSSDQIASRLVDEAQLVRVASPTSEAPGEAVATLLRVQDQAELLVEYVGMDGTTASTLSLSLPVAPDSTRKISDVAWVQTPEGYTGAVTVESSGTDLSAPSSVHQFFVEPELSDGLIVGEPLLEAENVGGIDVALNGGRVGIAMVEVGSRYASVYGCAVPVANDGCTANEISKPGSIPTADVQPKISKRAEGEYVASWWNPISERLVIVSLDQRMQVQSRREIELPGTPNAETRPVGLWEAGPTEKKRAELLFRRGTSSSGPVWEWAPETRQSMSGATLPGQPFSSAVSPDGVLYRLDGLVTDAVPGGAEESRLTVFESDYAQGFQTVVMGFSVGRDDSALWWIDGMPYDDVIARSTDRAYPDLAGLPGGAVVGWVTKGRTASVSFLSPTGRAICER